MGPMGNAIRAMDKPAHGQACTSLKKKERSCNSIDALKVDLHSILTWFSHEFARSQNVGVMFYSILYWLFQNEGDNRVQAPLPKILVWPCMLMQLYFDTFKRKKVQNRHFIDS